MVGILVLGFVAGLASRLLWPPGPVFVPSERVATGSDHGPPMVARTTQQLSRCPDVDCNTAEVARVQSRYSDLVEEHFGDGGHPVPWPNGISVDEAAAAEKRIRGWAQQCLPDDAFLSIRCEEYPCAFAYVAGAASEMCDTGWSDIDRTYLAGQDLTLEVRFALDAPSDPSADVRQRVPGRTNLFVRDWIAHRNAEVEER